jgi:F0F1-type ATP synthase alpha subunit
VEDVGSFEVAWRKFMVDNHSDVLATIESEKSISDSLEAKLAEICSNFVSNYVA